jgi:hypothetical protein
MPTSFSRVLNDDDLKDVRDQYLAALAALEEEEDAAADTEPAPTEPDAGAH